MTLTATIRRRVRDYIRAHDIFEPGPLVVACSGGPDSMTLVALLHALSGELGLVPHVAHFDHRMRPGSERDARAALGLAKSLGLPSHAGSAGHAPRSEGEARDARYGYLRGVAAHIGARAIALGHTQDDQAETVLLHLVRGSGIVGVAAMRPVRDDLRRPLLCLTREDTAAYAHTLPVRAVRDPSNRDPRFARNVVRLRVMPALERINPRARDALVRFAQSAAALSDALHARAEAALDAAAIASDDDGLSIDLDRLPEEEATRSEALALAAERAGMGVLSDRQRRSLLALSRGREGSARLDLPGARVALREYATLRLGSRADERAAPEPRELLMGRRVEWGGWTFLAGGDESGARGLPLRAQVPARDGLLVREWRAGDRLVGGRKVQDVLTDAKVPRRLRATHPVVLARSGEVVWVPGVVAARAGGREEQLRLAACPPDTGKA